MGEAALASIQMLMRVYAEPFKFWAFLKDKKGN